MKPDFKTMTKEELKAYLLENRDSQEAFYAYIDKLQDAPTLAVHSPNDNESLREVIEKIRQRNYK
jgi:hypothetical protein